MCVCVCVCVCVCARARACRACATVGCCGAAQKDPPLSGAELGRLTDGAGVVAQFMRFANAQHAFDNEGGTFRIPVGSRSDVRNAWHDIVKAMGVKRSNFLLSFKPLTSICVSLLMVIGTLSVFASFCSAHAVAIERLTRCWY